MTPAPRSVFAALLGVGLCLLVVAQVNHPVLTPQGELSLFALAGVLLCLHTRPLWRGRGSAMETAGRLLDRLLSLAAAGTFGWVFVQSEPAFRRWWLTGQSLGDRAGQESGLDIAVGVAGLLLVLEATRRAIGWALPILSGLFLAYAYFGSSLPGWMLPHRGYGVGRIVSQSFLHSQGVFGIALSVMFTYVFLFVLFGAFLEKTGATGFIIDLARRAFRGSVGAPAKVSVLSSGLMGSLSGSAVANTATTGTFTIPMMRSAGFPAAIAGGVEAAASSGGALVPPVMGAGAYMMLEIVSPPVSYLQIIRAALLPAILYYLSLFLLVHFYSKRRAAAAAAAAVDTAPPRLQAAAGMVFAVAFAGLLLFLLLGYTAFRAASIGLLLGLLASLLSSHTRPSWKDLLDVCLRAGRESVPLIVAAACVGIVLGVVTLTGAGTRLPSLLLPLAERNLFLALLALMLSSLVLGMGLPSAVCYLLLATLVGPVLGSLGVVPLAAHFFIFYFGMMSMVTPPVALAGYTAASIAGADIMRTSLAAFRFALVGFTLPFMFVYRPALLLLGQDGGAPSLWAVAGALTVAVAGITAFAAGMAGRLMTNLPPLRRGLLLLSAFLLLAPGPSVPILGLHLPVLDSAGFAVLAMAVAADWRARALAAAA